MTMHKALAHFLRIHQAYVAPDAINAVQEALLTVAYNLDPQLRYTQTPLPRPKRALMEVWSHTFRFFMSGNAIHNAPDWAYTPLARATRHFLASLREYLPADRTLRLRRQTLPLELREKLAVPFMTDSQWSSTARCVGHCLGYRRSGLLFLHRPDAPHVVARDALVLVNEVEQMLGIQVHRCSPDPVSPTSRAYAKSAREHFLRLANSHSRDLPVLN